MARPGLPWQTRQGSTISDLSATSAGECYAAGQAQGSADWTGFILHTSDAGATWSEEYAEDSLKPNAVAFSASAAVAVGDGSLRLVRDAATAKWNQYEPGVRKNLTNVQFWDTKLGWAVGWKSTILRTTDGGKKWAAASVPSGISLEGIDMVTKKTGWAVGCSGPHVPYSDSDAGYGAVVLKTTNGGLNWKFQLNRTTKPGLAGVDFTDAKHGVAVGTNGLVARTQDGGKTWWLRTVGSQTLRDVKFLTASSGVAVGGDSTSTGGSGSAWMTSDGGANWKAATLPQDDAHAAPIRAIFQQVLEGGSTLYAVGDRSQLYTSGDGATWTFTDLTPAVVSQDPPFMLGLDVGVTTLAKPEEVSPADATGWLLSDDGAMWTQNSGAWNLPPTVASFTPTTSTFGDTLTIYGSGFKPKISSRTGSIDWVDVDDGGSGYTTAPIVTIELPGSGRQATAEATIDSSGQVTAIAVTDGGSGYTPGMHTVTIEEPPLGGVRARATAYSASTAVVKFARRRARRAHPHHRQRADRRRARRSGHRQVQSHHGQGQRVESGTIGHSRDDPGDPDPPLESLRRVRSGQPAERPGRGGLGQRVGGGRPRDHPLVRQAPSQLDHRAVERLGEDAATDAVGQRRQVGRLGSPMGGRSARHRGQRHSAHRRLGQLARGTTARRSPSRVARMGMLPGSRHVIYYQAIDNVGNMELDPFWRARAADDPAYEVPKHAWVTLDTLGPQTYAPWPVTVKRNSKPAFDFWVNDDLSSKAKVTIVVKNGSGSTVKTLSLGWLSTFHEFSSPISDWKCTLAKGSYTFEVLASDQAGNPQALKGTNTFTVN